MYQSIASGLDKIRNKLHQASTIQAAKWLSASGKPPICVIITTRNRATYLDLTLSALARQSLPHTGWEIILCDTGSQDQTSETLAALDKKFNLTVLTSEPDETRNTVLNRAIDMAQGQSVVFLRDDQILAPDCLLFHVRQQTLRPSVVLGYVAGRLHTHIFSQTMAPLMGTQPLLALSPEDLHRLDAVRDLIDERPYFLSESQLQAPIWQRLRLHNCSFPREALLQCGGIDPCYQTDEMMAIDLGYRLFCNGMSFIEENRATSLKQITPWPTDYPTCLKHDLRHFASMNHIPHSVLNAFFVMGK